MKGPKLLHYLNDPRDPEVILAGLTAEELAELLDALYQNLDTAEPAFGAEAWYDLAVEESSRRTVSPDGAAHGVA